MKKMMIAVLAVLSAASMARADEMRMDFDGNGTAALEVNAFRENPEFNVPEPLPRQDEDFAYLNEGVVNGVIKGAMAYCAHHGKVSAEADFGNLLKYGSMEEKMGFVYNKRGTYVFPADIVARRFAAEVAGGFEKMSKGATDLTCLSWTTDRVCTNRQVCRIACAAAAGAAGAWAGGAIGAGAAASAAGQICQELCEMVEECSDVRVCASWATSAGYGETDSHGHYRSRVKNLSI